MNKTQQHVRITELSTLFTECDARREIPRIAAKCLGDSIPLVERLFYESVVPHLSRTFFLPERWWRFDEKFLNDVNNDPEHVLERVHEYVAPWWETLRASIEFLRSCSKPLEARRDLEILARVFFDGDDVRFFFPCSQRDRTRLSQRYTNDFMTLYARVSNTRELSRGDLRVREFLYQSQPSGTTPKR